MGVVEQRKRKDSLQVICEVYENNKLQKPFVVILSLANLKIKARNLYLSAVLHLKDEQRKATENYTMTDFINVSKTCSYFYGVTKRMGLAGHVTHMGELNTRIL
jgi:hypothetical protein